MIRARDALAAAWWWATLAAALLWWAPTVALWLLTRAAVRARFATEMAAADVLAFAGCERAARRVLAGVIVRNRRKMRAAEARKRAARGRRASSFTIP